MTEQHTANERFGEAGVVYLGWYHSHPRIKPLPSNALIPHPTALTCHLVCATLGFKDLEMQAEMQAQVPHSLGLICSR